MSQHASSTINKHGVWFDSHAHLQAESYADDRQEVLLRARKAGVERILIPSTNWSDSLDAIRLARQHEELVCAVGCHPHDASDFDKQSMDDWLKRVTQERMAPIVAIGEIGLDYHYDYSPREDQRRVFRLQLELAHELDLPVIIHEREATADGLSILEKAISDGLFKSEPGVFHCFSGSVETAKIVLQMGFYLGLDGPVTFKNAKKPLAVLEHCPQDRLLIETDSPYLTPAPHRGKRNEPAYLPLIGEKVAEIWGVSLDTAARLTNQNARRLFELGPG
jgi:TatD DNase family protein